MAGGLGLIIADFILSFMWVWSGVITKIIAHKLIGFGTFSDPFLAEVLKSTLSILNMFFFALLVKLTRGAAYNPLTVLSSAFSGDFMAFLFVIGSRIPAQVLGSITGVRMLIETFPEIGRGPKLNVHIHHGALTEGMLTFAIVNISLGLARKVQGGFFMKTWISSVSKLALHILGSDLTGGCMNPAAVLGWAYARGDHITKEHIFVYWLAPIEATLLAVWTFRWIVPSEKEKEATKAKSE